jgi:phage tail-like protein
MSATALMRPGGGPPSRVPADYAYIERVVRIGFPVKEARTYLRRHLGNPIGYRLVEAQRGERVGQVREAEVHPHSAADPVHIRALRTLPDGTPASYYTPEDLVEIRAEIQSSTGAAIAPLQSKDRVILHVPVRSYLRFLPGVYQGAVPTMRRDVAQADERSMRRWGARDEVETSAVTAGSSDRFRRFLLMFQHMMTTVTDRIDAIPDLTDPLVADAKFLPWIASWVAFELDGSLPLHQQRELVRRSIRLQRTRGTVAGVREMIRVLTAAPVRLIERQKPKACVLGGLTLAGGRTVEERYLRDEPPAHYAINDGRAATTFFMVLLESREAFQKRFGERAPAVLRRISQIVSNERPAQVTFTIQFDEGVP